MSALRVAFARVVGLFRSNQGDDDIREEMQMHLEMETAENIRRGMSPVVARREALMASGGMTQAAESVRGQRGLPWVDYLLADIRYGTRSLLRAPAFTAVVVTTLALGIGANTAIFSVVRGVLLKPLPHRDGERLVYLRHSMDGPAGQSVQFSVPEIRDLRASARSISGIAEFAPFSFTLAGNGDAARIDVGLVTGNYFEVMGLSPVLGRLTRPSDDGVGVPAVMVLTHEYWQSHFGGDSSVIGRQVRLNGRSATIVGVVQAAPYFPDRVEALLNMVVSDHHTSAMMVEGRTHRMTEVVARIAPHATLAQAKSEIASIYSRMQLATPEAYSAASHYRVSMIPFKEVLGENARLTLWLLMGAAAFVMMISAANVVNLTLMRGVRREHELVIRAALGSGMLRLRRLLLVENLLLTTAGAVAGVVIAFAGLRLLVALAARYSPRASEIELDGAVLLFTLGLSVALALLLSFAASMPKEGAFASWIAAGGKRVSGGIRKQRLQRGLVVAQVAVSVMLLVGAGLLTRTMMQLSQVPTGLNADEVLTMQVSILELQEAFNPAAHVVARERFGRMRDEIRRLPGVVEVGIGSTMPLRRTQLAFDVKAEGVALAAGEAQPRAETRTASPEYFRASGIPLLTGRAFSDGDQLGTTRVVIVNQTLARRLFPNTDPLGKRIAYTGEVLKFTPFSTDWRTIVGVVGDTRDGALDAEPRAAMFTPFAQEPAMLGGLVIRADSNAALLAGPALRIARSVAPTAPVENVWTVTQIKDQSVTPRRLNAVLISSFSMLAVIIAAVGIAGVLAFSVSARTNEIGIRMSLGADAGRVQRMVLREGGVLLGIGLTIGAVGALFAARVIQGLLFGVAPNDPVTLVVVTLLMGIIGIGACWIPARRASRIDPVIAMRS